MSYKRTCKNCDYEKACTFSGYKLECSHWRGWIPLNKELPPQNRDFLFEMETGYLVEGYLDEYCGKIYVCNLYNDTELEQFAYWRELPPSFKNS